MFSGLKPVHSWGFSLRVSHLRALGREYRPHAFVLAVRLSSESAVLCDLCWGGEHTTPSLPTAPMQTLSSFLGRPFLVLGQSTCLTDAETHRWTDTEAGRHTDAQTHGCTDTQVYRCTDAQTHRQWGLRGLAGCPGTDGCPAECGGRPGCCLPALMLALSFTVSTQHPHASYQARLRRRRWQGQAVRGLWLHLCPSGLRPLWGPRRTHLVSTGDSAARGHPLPLTSS